MSLTREQRRMATELLRMDDWSDPWGTAVSHAHGAIDVIWHVDPSKVPANWQYRHSPCCDGPIATYHAPGEPCPPDCDADDIWPDVEYVPFLDAGELGIEMLIYVVNVCRRMARWAERAGLDY